MPVERMCEPDIPRICLPTKDERSGVNYMHHILYAPSVLDLIDPNYNYPPDDTEPVKLALLLAVLATTAYSWSVFASKRDAQYASFLWLEAALDVLLDTRRMERIPLEHNQATVVGSYLVYNVEGLTLRFRLLRSTAIFLIQRCPVYLGANVCRSGIRQSWADRALELRISSGI